LLQKEQLVYEYERVVAGEGALKQLLAQGALVDLLQIFSMANTLLPQ
jgi:hypothetical protein